jgi:hypothetical protein
VVVLSRLNLKNATTVFVDCRDYLNGFGNPDVSYKLLRRVRDYSLHIRDNENKIKLIPRDEIFSRSLWWY